MKKWVGTEDAWKDFFASARKAVRDLATERGLSQDVEILVTISCNFPGENGRLGGAITSYDKGEFK